MREFHFEPTEYIYRERDRPDYAFAIRSGVVEIGWPNGMRAPTRLTTGEVFGQIGIITDQPRSRSALAVTPVTVLAFSRSDFLSALNARLDVVEPFLRRLFATLHEVEALLDQEQPAASPPVAPPSAPPTGPQVATPPPPVAVGSIRITAASPQLLAQLGDEGVPVEELPFRIGRKPAKGERLSAGGLGLVLADQKPFNLSRRHFSIEMGPDAVFVRDTGSHLGTVVNGTRIGGPETARVALLRIGENEIVAGGQSSPFVFRVVVAEA